MSVHLDRIQNWLGLAEEANWLVGKVARKMGVSIRLLERHFLQSIGIAPKIWFMERRQRRALERHGYSVKETAGLLGYRYRIISHTNLKRIGDSFHAHT